MDLEICKIFFAISSQVVVVTSSIFIKNKMKKIFINNKVDERNDIVDMGSEKKVIVQFKKSYFDISTFLSKHPGGMNTIDKLNEKNIDKKFKCYQHSFAAENLLDEYKIDDKNEDTKLEVCEMEFYKKIHNKNEIII